MFKSSGTLIYDPTFEYKTNTTKEPYWLIVNCCKGIMLYYNHLTTQALNRRPDYPPLRLMQPAWYSHISVVRSETPLYPELWKKHHYKKVDFFYDPFVHTNYIHYWLKVRCPQLRTIREELGLTPKPQKIVNNKTSEIGLHLTIGVREINLPNDGNEDKALDYLDGELKHLKERENDPERIAVVKYKIRKIRSKLNKPPLEEYYGDDEGDEAEG